MREVPTTLAEKLGTAIASFAELGFDQTRIEDLSVATGVASSTLYYYFSGKEDVLAFLLRQWLGEVTAAVADATSTDQPARDRLVAVVQAQLRLIRDNPTPAASCSQNSGGSRGCRTSPSWFTAPSIDPSRNSSEPAPPTSRYAASTSNL